MTGSHTSNYHMGFQNALENAEKKVREEEQIREEDTQAHASKHELGFQHALQNAEHKVLEEEARHLLDEHKKLKEQDRASSSKHSLGFQNGLRRAERKVLEEAIVHEEDKLAEALKAGVAAKQTKEDKLAEALKAGVAAKRSKEDKLAEALKAGVAAKRENEDKLAEALKAGVAATVREAERKTLGAEEAREMQKKREEKKLRKQELREADEEGERLEYANTRRLMSKRAKFDPWKAVKKGFEDASEAGRKAVGNIKKGLDDIYNTAGKPLMGPINTMRAELCIRRKPLLTHKPCMKFMVKQCKEQTTGKGYCKKFFHMVLDACFRAQQQGEDPEKFCELSEQLGSKRDADEDGVPDITDRFPADREEWGDMDNDGIGDNVDPDRDGDGLNNEADEFPDDPTLPEQGAKGDMDGDGIPDDEDPDMDGDGYNNTLDGFPRDPLRPAPVPAPAPVAEAPPPAAPAAAPAGGPGSKTIRDLPEQGYGEYYRGNLVRYADGDDFSEDWRNEWPLKETTGTETYADYVAKACVDHPKSSWCMRFKRKHGIHKHEYIEAAEKDPSLFDEV